MFWLGLLIGLFAGATIAWFALALYLASAASGKS